MAHVLYAMGPQPLQKNSQRIIYVISLAGGVSVKLQTPQIFELSATLSAIDSTKCFKKVHLAHPFLPHYPDKPGARPKSFPTEFQWNVPQHPTQFHWIPLSFSQCLWSEKSGCLKQFSCLQNLVSPSDPEKGPKWGKTVQISRKSSKLTFRGGGERNFMDKTILWTSGLFWSEFSPVVWKSLKRPRIRTLEKSGRQRNSCSHPNWVLAVFLRVGCEWLLL